MDEKHIKLFFLVVVVLLALVCCALLVAVNVLLTQCKLSYNRC